MNLRLDEHSLRLRLALSEAQQLRDAGELKQAWSVAGLSLEIELLLTSEVASIDASFDVPLCVVRVEREALERAIARVPAKDAGIYATNDEGHEYALEIDSFSAKAKRVEGSTPKKT